jgi:hypothetical protein
MKETLTEAYFRWIDTIHIKNGVNITLTAKQSVGLFRLDQLSLSRNIRYFKNMLNRKVFGNAFKRFGKQLSMLFVHEQSALDRLHVHGVLERPERISFEKFKRLIEECWKKTLFGYDQTDIKNPTTFGEVVGWKNYIMKKKSGIDFSGSIDLENSSCFALSRL